MMMRILLISPTLPSDMSFGSAQRGALLYRALSECGQVRVLVLREGDQPAPDCSAHPEVAAALSVPARPWLQRYSAAPQARAWWLRHGAGKYDLVVGRYLSPVTMLGALDGVRSIVDADDAYYRYARDASSLASALVAGAKSFARTALTARALRRFDHVWFCSGRDRRVFDVAHGSVLPNIAPLPLQACDDAQPDGRTLLLVGSMWYAPNRDAADWFIAQCWNEVRAAVPGARLRIVGPCSVEQRQAWMRTPGVECPGFVDDLAAEYRQASCAIAPIRYGGGTQIKAVEAYAYGRPSVVSPFVYEGLSTWFESEKSMLVGANALLMAAACIRLLRDPAEARRLAAAGRQVTQSALCWDAFRTEVVNTVQAAMPARAPVSTPIA